jgi:transglutaminase-like putative cysteine protease
VTALSKRQYAVHQQLVLSNQGAERPEKQNLWVALIRDFAPYQEVTSMKVSPEDYKLIVDEYGNEYAEFDFSGQLPGSTRTVEIEYRVVVNELAYDLSSCQGELPGEFTQPELHIESLNPQVVALGEELSRGKDTVCHQVQAFYDYIGDELVYTPNEENWGAQATFGSMGSDCTEYTSLLVALSRSKDIPSRYFEGLLYMDESSDAPARTEHAWPDVYLPAVGWTALDPTRGRPPADRQAYFAHYTPNHIIVTLGVNPSVLRVQLLDVPLCCGIPHHIQVDGNGISGLSMKRVNSSISPFQPAHPLPAGRVNKTIFYVNGWRDPTGSGYSPRLRR